MRRKPWARPELAACPFFIDYPAALRGSWREAFAAPSLPLWLELGCGKGVSTAQLAAQTPGVNLLAVDIKSEVLAVAKRSADAAFAEAGRPVDNLLLTACDVERIAGILSPEDGVELILINFCNPWSKPRCHKHRLTHTRQLITYRTLLRPGGELRFKTDDDGLFFSTLRYLEEAGYRLLERIDSLDAGHPASAFVSEHERKFRAEGLPIHYLAAAPIPEETPQ